MKLQVFKICLISMVLAGFAVSVAAQQNQNSAEKEFDDYEQTRNLSQTSATTSATNKVTVKKKIKKRPTPKPTTTQRKKLTNSNKTTVSSVGAPGMKIWLERQTNCNGQFSLVAPTAIFQSDDCLRMRFRLNFEGFLTIINLGTSGKNDVIFPLENQPNRVFPKTDNYLPDNQGWEFNENPGREQFVFIVSRTETNQEVVQNYVNNRGLVTNNSSDFEVYNDRDVKPRTEKDSVYVLSNDTRLEKPLVFRMTIKHQ